MITSAPWAFCLKRRSKCQIDATVRQIDNLVYGLYRLTEEEIGIVEGAR